MSENDTIGPEGAESGLRAAVEALADLRDREASNAERIDPGFARHLRADAADLHTALAAAVPASAPDVDDVARVLMAAWEEAEGKPVTPSYVATFADMARAVIAGPAPVGEGDAAPAPRRLRDAIQPTRSHGAAKEDQR